MVFSVVLGCKLEGRLNIILFNILVVYLYGLEFLLFVLIYSWECCELLLKVDIIDVLLIVFLKFNFFFCEKVLLIEVVERLSILVVLEVVDILFIVFMWFDLSLLFGVCLFLLLFFRLSRCLCDRVFLCLCEGVCDWLGFFRVSFLGEFVIFKLLLEFDGDKEFGNKG